ncbi:MAG: sigma-70 family RNA polymerase sigma factor [Caldilineaceae bacterium]|nr:sigma-70 family RNA polymerase sigma factor [Caldilineaceae bacterium]
MDRLSTQDVTKLSDEELLARTVAQDVQAFEALYDRHAKTVYSLILRVVRDPEAAEELVQESFWQVWRKAEQFNGNGAVGAWLSRIGRNKALDHLRRLKARPQSDGSVPETLERIPAPESRQVEAEVSRSWDRQHLQEALAAIPDEQRRCLEMAYFDGKSQREIAEVMGMPIGTIKTRVRIGLEKLERSLRAVGYVESGVQ